MPHVEYPGGLPAGEIQRINDEQKNGPGHNIDGGRVPAQKSEDGPTRETPRSDTDTPSPTQTHDHATVVEGDGDYGTVKTVRDIQTGYGNGYNIVSTDGGTTRTDKGIGTVINLKK